MRVIVIAIAVMALGSCCRMIPQRCIETQVDTIRTIQVDTFETVRDTTIWLHHYIPGKTVVDSIPYPVYIGSDGLVNSDTLWMETDLATAWAVVQRSILKGELVQRDTILALEIMLQDAIRETTILKNQVTEITNQNYVIKHKKGRLERILWVVLAIAAVILLVKVVSKLKTRGG